MTERAFLLFNEYINIAGIYNVDSTNLLDVKKFIIKKTISPIKLNKTPVLNDLYSFYSMWDRFIVNLFTNIANFSNIDTIDCYDILESISSILLNVCFKLYSKDLLYLVNQELLYIENSLPDNNNISSLIYSTNTAKLKLELYLYISTKIDNISTIESIVLSILDNSELEDSSVFLSTNIDFKNHSTYKNYIEIINTLI
jgi:hypothetical protein